MLNKCTINIIKIQSHIILLSKLHIIKKKKKRVTIKIIYCTLRIVSIIRIIYYLFLRDMHS